jgi:hypothetical protein
MNFATKNNYTRILVWLIWFIVLLVFSQPAHGGEIGSQHTAPLLGVVSHNPQDGPLFPWQLRYRWKKQALRRYRAWRRAYRRAKWAARGARLALGGAITLAQVVNWMITRQQAVPDWGTASHVCFAGDAPG